MQGPGIFESPQGLSEKWPDFGNKVLNQQTIPHYSPIFANWMQSRFLFRDQGSWAPGGMENASHIAGDIGNIRGLTAKHRWFGDTLDG